LPELLTAWTARARLLQALSSFCFLLFFSVFQYPLLSSCSSRLKLLGKWHTLICSISRAPASLSSFLHSLHLLLVSFPVFFLFSWVLLQLINSVALIFSVLFPQPALR